MPKELPRPTPKGRYAYWFVVQEIERQLQVRPRGALTQAAEALALDTSSFAHRLAGKKSRFTIEQLGVLADHWSAPLGWPFIDWHLGEALASKRR